MKAIAGQRTWTALHFLSFYLTMTFSPSSYNLGATLVSLGLVSNSGLNLIYPNIAVAKFLIKQWWHGIVAAVIGSGLLSVIVILNSRGASMYHVGFPVYVRASAGVSGSKLFVAVRASVATIYFATQTYYVCFCHHNLEISSRYANLYRVV